MKAGSELQYNKENVGEKENSKSFSSSSSEESDTSSESDSYSSSDNDNNDIESEIVVRGKSMAGLGSSTSQGPRPV